MYKILTAVVARLMWRHINDNEIMAPEQRGCIPGSQGCKEHLMFDKFIMEDARAKQRHIHMAFLDFRKAFDSVSHQWIIVMLKMYRFHPSLIEVIERSMKTWQLVMSIREKGEVKLKTDTIVIRRGIFQGDTLSPLLFCLCLNPISFELNQSSLGYHLQCDESSVTVNHSWYMDDVKLYGRTEAQMESLTSTVSHIAGDYGMELNPKKCAVIHVQRGRMVDGTPIVVDNRQLAKALTDEDTYKYLGVVEAAMIPHQEVKTAIQGEYKSRLQLLMDSGLHAYNLSKAINTYALPVLTYSFGVINWNKDELQQLDCLTRRMLTACGFHHPKASVNRLYMKRQDGGRGFLSCEDMHGRIMCGLSRYMRTSASARMRILHQYHGKRTTKGHSVTAAADGFLASLQIPESDREHATKSKVRSAVNAKKMAAVRAMPLHGAYWTRLEDQQLDETLTFAWLRAPGIRPNTEGMVQAAQDQCLKTRNYEYAIMKTIPRNKANCRICNDHLETIDHVLSGCPTLARTSYIERHNRVVKYVHYSICKNKKLETAASRYHQQLRPLTANERYRLYWEYSVPTDLQVGANRPDLLLVDEVRRSAWIVDISIPSDANVTKKFSEKKAKYFPLQRELKRLWNLEEVQVVPVICGALGGMAASIVDMLATIQGGKPDIVQQEALLGSMRILRTILNV